ncbi:alkaline phosphatase [Actinoplanes sp. SE50]|uniref:metallophosphoesterase family protein n=1 Tax=unclassified Actinoplanes TaxID=2626549 RepID=UPI00023EBBD2|nr:MULTISPECIES: metallophosphoesterase [unclassified Actinoplanes]AEV85687.1 alkaline phosphatase [Actinoplanes sp. SE50/110]ATO84080.1 alkaline phosphatase [Actinoplanes sp. SE50]SLM01490.1 alkaline phosphatase [Actinoplanes sp. SE50/110]
MTALVRRLLGERSRRRMRWARRHTVLCAIGLLVAVLAAVVVSTPASRRLIVGPDTVTVVAVGDMACDPADPDLKRATREQGDRCRQQAVSDIAVALRPDALLALGDVQYEMPTAEAFRTVYGPSFGRLRDRTVPVYGNQEYKVQDASSFTAYFGDRILDKRGYWSQQIGRWHVVVLDSNCSAVPGGCGSGSPQQTWLDADLAATSSRCVLAAWHHPRWSTGIAGPDDRTAELYRTLYRRRVDLVLSGHEADYQRFEPLNPDGVVDPEGVRQFVVGTGGQAHYRPEGTAATGAPPGAYADYDHHGVLALTLRPASYDWAFHPLEAGRVTEDEGSARCH